MAKPWGKKGRIFCLRLRCKTTLCCNGTLQLSFWCLVNQWGQENERKWKHMKWNECGVPNTVVSQCMPLDSLIPIQNQKTIINLSQCEDGATCTSSPGSVSGALVLFPLSLKHRLCSIITWSSRMSHSSGVVQTGSSPSDGGHNSGHKQKCSDSGNGSDENCASGKRAVRRVCCEEKGTWGEDGNHFCWNYFSSRARKTSPILVSCKPLSHQVTPLVTRTMMSLYVLALRCWYWTGLQ